MRESSGERAFERENEVGEGRGRRGEKNAFLNVMAREHREVGDGELEFLNGGFTIGKYGGVGEDGGG